MSTAEATKPARVRWTHQWKELHDEVINSGLCTGCAGCVIACPHDVIGYKHEPGHYKPFHLEDELGEANCTHGEKGCTSCTRACPRFRDWETEADEHLAGAGSRYTYSANTMAYPEAKEKGLERLALVGMSCQTSIAPVMWHRKVGKVSKPFKLNIGLLCSKSFDDSLFDELFGVKYGLNKDDIVKMNIKGVFQVWMKDGSYHEINLKECHAWTREGCIHCPDFAAEHADISTGGIGNETDWTLTVVRTDLGRAIIEAMIKDGVIDTRPGDDDPAAIDLMRRLSQKSRERWPQWANQSAAVGLPTRKK